MLSFVCFTGFQSLCELETYSVELNSDIRAPIDLLPDPTSILS